LSQFCLAQENPLRIKASDGDLYDITINTSDQALFQNALGGYVFDNTLYPLAGFRTVNDTLYAYQASGALAFKIYLGAPPVTGDVLTADANKVLTFAAPVAGGDISSVGDVASGAAFSGTQGTVLTFNNAGGDGTFQYDGSVFAVSHALTIQASNPADAEAIRLDNNEGLAWESSPAGTDITLKVDASEILQASGTFNAVTLTESANAVPNATDNLSFFAATTSVQFAGVLSDETGSAGSGLVVFNQSPTISGATLQGVIDISAATSMTIPNSASPTVDAFGELAADNNLWASGRGAPVFYDGTVATALVNVLVSDNPVNGQTIKWNTGGTITWEDDISGGGGGTPGGSDTYIQFNDASAFGGDADFAWDKTNNIETLNGRRRFVEISAPAASTADNIDVYAKDYGGRTFVSVRDADNAASPVQTLFGKSQAIIAPGTSSAVTAIGIGAAASGTVSHPTASETNGGYSTNFATSTTSGNSAGVASAANQFFRGSVSGANGFTFFARVLYPDASYTSVRTFVGMGSTALSTMLGADNPASSSHYAGFQFSTARGDANWQFVTDDNVSQNINRATLAFASNKVYNFWIFCKPQGSTIFWQIDNVTDGTTASGSTSMNLPGTSTSLRPVLGINNITGTARNIRMKKIVIETDY
jgi:hypothetical protein